MEIRKKPAWITLKGGIPLPASDYPRAEQVIDGSLEFDLDSLLLRDPEKFVAGQIHSCLLEWELIMEGAESGGNVLKWIRDGINIFEFFQAFKGNYKGKHFDSEIPPRQYFQNANICQQYSEFITNELSDKIASGAIRLLGRVGECQPPRVIMPLTIEPSKPRLCHDERFVNLWIKDLPFRLDTLKDVHRLVDKHALMVTCDEKSGYNHVRLDDDSQTFFGIQFGGFYMVYATLPFGWKASPFIYQSIGISVTSYLRKLSVCNLLYIDDRLVITKGGNSGNEEDVYLEAKRFVYCLLQLLTRLGYTVNLNKCSLEPSTCKRYLGFLVDSVQEAYVLPEDKKGKFIQLREFILSKEDVDVRTLQRFSGKCVSMSLAVPGCKLFCREVNAAISQCLRNSRNVKVSGPLREELEHWRFLDGWKGYSRWRSEFHKKVEVFTDSSGYRYGACVELGEEKLVLGDYWKDGDTRPIHIKEADAILKSLLSLNEALQNSRVDVFSDSMAVIGSWNSQGSKCGPLNDVIKRIFYFIVNNNVDLHFTFVPSELNVAHKPSRVRSASDTMLSEKSWALVESGYGPHSVDLMALDSNAMKARDGTSLKHFTPWMTPLSAGVNVFCQDIRVEANPYVFPPFGLIFPVLCFLEQQKVSFTIVVPKLNPLPLWWPKLVGQSVGSLCLGGKGEKGVVKVPSRRGFVLDNVGLRWSLFAFRVSFE